jgi:hypothetical protein
MTRTALMAIAMALGVKFPVKLWLTGSPKDEVDIPLLNLKARQGA